MKKRSFWLCPLYLISFSACWIPSDQQSLGGKFTLVNGNKKEEREIIFCTRREFETCISGTLLFPLETRRYDSKGRCAEYIESAKADKKWVLAKTFRVKDQASYFWIIDKSLSAIFESPEKDFSPSALRSKIFGPFDQRQFNNKLLELDIDMMLD